MRLVHLPADETQLVDLDSIVSVKLRDDARGQVALPTNHGTAFVGVSIGEGWSLDLELSSGTTMTWETYENPSDATSEMHRLARLVGDWGRFKPGM